MSKVFKNETDPKELETGKGIVRPLEVLLHDIEALKTDRTSTETVDEVIFWLSQLRKHNNDLEQRMRADPSKFEVVVCYREDQVDLFLDGQKVSGDVAGVNCNVSQGQTPYVAFSKMPAIHTAAPRK